MRNLLLWDKTLDWITESLPINIKSYETEAEYICLFISEILKWQKLLVMLRNIKKNN